MTLQCVYTGLFMLIEMALNFRFILFPRAAVRVPAISKMRQWTIQVSLPI